MNLNSSHYSDQIGRANALLSQISQPNQKESQESLSIAYSKDNEKRLLKMKDELIALRKEILSPNIASSSPESLTNRAIKPKNLSKIDNSKVEKLSSLILKLDSALKKHYFKQILARADILIKKAHNAPILDILEHIKMKNKLIFLNNALLSANSPPERTYSDQEVKQKINELSERINELNKIINHDYTQSSEEIDNTRDELKKLRNQLTSDEDLSQARKKYFLARDMAYNFIDENNTIKIDNFTARHSNEKLSQEKAVQYILESYSPINQERYEDYLHQRRINPKNKDQYLSLEEFNKTIVLLFIEQLRYVPLHAHLPFKLDPNLKDNPNLQFFKFVQQNLPSELREFITKIDESSTTSTLHQLFYQHMVKSNVTKVFLPNIELLNAVMGTSEENKVKQDLYHQFKDHFKDLRQSMSSESDLKENQHFNNLDLPSFDEFSKLLNEEHLVRKIAHKNIKRMTGIFKKVFQSSFKKKDASEKTEKDSNERNANGSLKKRLHLYDEYYSEFADPEHHAIFSVEKNGDKKKVKDIWINSLVKTSYANYLKDGQKKEREQKIKEADRKFDVPNVQYFSNEERNASLAQLKVVNGSIEISKRGDKSTLDGRNYCFVLGTDGAIYLTEKMLTDEGQIQHSSFLHGAPVLSAGFFEIENGILKAICFSSGHYQTNENQMKEIVLRLYDLVGPSALEINFKDHNKKVVPLVNILDIHELSDLEIFRSKVNLSSRKGNVYINEFEEKEVKEKQGGILSIFKKTKAESIKYCCALRKNNNGKLDLHVVKDHIKNSKIIHESSFNRESSELVGKVLVKNGKLKGVILEAHDDENNLKNMKLWQKYFKDNGCKYNNLNFYTEKGSQLKELIINFSNADSDSEED